ncbi:hypothetical protein [Pelagicoccus mobilis]|uniref:Uncharacterized protein n=1 Tax=Pelagicoccus mobilis TaxID=415221 RepID=A0A934S1E6_9BACT|nr:hypothetical protein [Pelagicoccus mobilis]MBK1879390.1 hypothetical protein [Pelagicoccus mobilis]
MTVKECIHCGSAHANGTDCCSSGCDLARRLPMGDGDLPATWQLGVALGWGFLLFNQLLFAGMDFLSLSKNDPENAGKFAIASIAAGCLVAAASVFFFAISKPKLMTDWQILAVSVGLGVVGGYRLGEKFGEGPVLGFLIANILVCLWLARGLVRRSK